MSTHNVPPSLPIPAEGKSGWPWNTPGGNVVRTEKAHDVIYPRISIVTPSYNQGQFIEETIRSVLLQGYPNLEYIVIDGQSSDCTLDILRRYQKHFSFWISEPDNGPADAIRKGWKRATGEIIAYLNSDDAYLPGTLFTVARAFREFPETAMLCGNELHIDEAGYVLKQSTITDVTYTSLLELQFIPQPSIFVKREVLTQVGGIDPAIRYVFDFELWLRIARALSVHCIPDVLSVTRWHESTITLKHRPNIGEELVDVIMREMRLNPCRLARIERRGFIYQVHRLAMILHLDRHHAFQAARHALWAIALCPDIYSGKKIVRKYFKKLRRPMNQMNQLSQTPGDAIHWSHFHNSAL